MRQPHAPTVSLFERANKPDTARSVPFAAVLDGIRSGRWTEAVAAVRSVETKDERRALKLALLPAVTFSGTFSRRANDALNQHSGLVDLDFDDVEDPPALRDELGRHPNVRATFLSASATGVRALVPVEVVAPETGECRPPVGDAEHKIVWAAVAARFPRASLDLGCKDVARLCYVSHDPDMKVNEAAEPVACELRADSSDARQGRPNPPPDDDVPLTLDEIADLLGYLRRPATSGDYPYWLCVYANLLAFAAEHGHPAADARGLMEQWSPARERTDYPDDDRGLDKGHAGAFVNLLKDAGLDYSAWLSERYRRLRTGGRARDDWERSSGRRDGQKTPPSLEWIPFPADALPPSCAEYARAKAAAVGCDVAFVAASMLAVLAAAVGNSFRASVKASWLDPSALWLGVVASSGGGKSPAIEGAMLPVYRLEKAARERHAAEREDYDRALERYEALSKKDRLDAERPAEPARPRFRIGDATVESTLMIHEENPRGLLCQRDELAGWFDLMNRYAKGEADIAVWIELWGGRPVVVDRKSGDKQVLYVERPNVSVLGGIQPGVLRERAGRQLLDSGFLARLLLVMPPERALRWSDADVTPEVREDYAATVEAVYALPASDETLPLSGEARRIFGDFVNENADLYERLTGPLRAALVKLPSYVARFALALHLADFAADPDRLPSVTPGPVSADAVRRAVRLARWFRHEAARIYEHFGLAGDEPTDRDARLVSDLPEPFGWREVAAAWGVERRAAFDVLARLVERGLAEQSGHGEYHRADSAGATAPLHHLHFLHFAPEGGASDSPLVQKVQEVHSASEEGAPRAPLGDGTLDAPPVPDWTEADDLGEGLDGEVL